MTPWLAILAAGLSTLAAVDETATATTEKTYAVIYSPGPTWKPGVPMERQGLRDHFFYLRRLDEEQRILLAGPAGADGGLLVCHARDQMQAENLIAADPAVTAGVFRAELRPFTLKFASYRLLTPSPP